MKRWKRYLASEIGIEFKACLYFFVILFFYSLYRILHGSFQASIVCMAEMIICTYVIGYVQVYLLGNFDEGERIGKKEILAALGCTGVYTAVSYLCSWYDRNMRATGLFFFYILFCYFCAFLVYKVKRDIDTAQLNEDLERFKNRKA